VGVVFVVAGDVEGGELESVEEGSGAAAVDVVGGEVGDDGADGLLDGGAGGGGGQGDGVAAGVAGLGVGDGLALGVVEVAVVLGAEGVAAAAASVVEDVAAAEVVGDLAAEVGDGVEHGYPPPGESRQNPLNKGVRLGPRWFGAPRRETRIRFGNDKQNVWGEGSG